MYRLVRIIAWSVWQVAIRGKGEGELIPLIQSGFDENRLDWARHYAGQNCKGYWSPGYESLGDCIESYVDDFMAIYGSSSYAGMCRYRSEVRGEN